MTMAYHIKNWDDRENADTRKYVDLVWFRSRVKLFGEGIGYTLAAPNGRGPHLYGMFKLIEQIAAGGRQEQRGWLIRNGTPLDAGRIANLLRLPTEDCQEVLTFFSTPPLDWLELADYPGESPVPLPPPDHNPPIAGRLPGESPVPLPSPGRHPGEMRHPTDRPTDRITNVPRERERESCAPPSMAEVLTSRTRVGLLLRQIRELEADRANLSEADREGLRKKKRDLAALQAKQADGDFTHTPTKTKA